MIENLLLSTGGSALLGFLAGFALKRILKIAAVIIGAFVLGLAYLSYKGWVAVNWPIVARQTRSAAYNATGAVLHQIDTTAIQYSQHPAMFESQAMPIAALFGFVPGFLVGLRH